MEQNHKKDILYLHLGVMLFSFSGIIAGMETVYGIFFAFVLLREIPTARELIGGAVILGVSIITSLDKSN